MARYAPLYGLIRGLVRYGVFGVWGGFRVEGLENVPPSGGLLLAANHVSFADPPAVACAIERQVRFMAQEALFKPPVFGPLIRKLGAFPVRRGEADMAAIRNALETLDSGMPLVIFPEGGRGDGKTLRPANKGVALLARKSNAPVVPIGIVGADKWLPAGRKIPRFTRITVRFGEPFRHGEAAEFGPELMSRISDLCGVPVSSDS